jgi:glycosyltransferase involved in cell wall biosynthesis
MSTDDAAIRDNAGTFARLLGLAEARAATGRWVSSIEWARAAASYAMTNPAGVLRSHRLEQVVDAVAAQALAPSPPRGAAAPGGVRRVLHVVSEARSIGGLTRLAARWMRKDSSSVSSVVVTLQSNVVDFLADAAIGSGGAAVAFGLGDPIAQAARLRGLAEDADIVIGHLHPGDPVPALAFGAGYGGAPVALFNHSDHLFWLAPTHATLVVDFRDAGSTLTRDARGYADSAMHTLPLLVPQSEAQASEPIRRSDLGFGPDHVIALSVARAVKFQDTSIEPRFADILAGALEQNPRLVFCAVGPGPDDSPWPRLLARFPGRIHLAGPRSDPHAFFGAADLYIDTFPFSSLTSLLEASAASLPALTFNGHRGLRRALGIADFVSSDESRPQDLAAFYERLRELIRDPELRRARGEEAQRTFLAMTPEEPWLEKVEALYSRLGQLRDSGQTIGTTAPGAPHPELLSYSQAILAIEQRAPLLWSIRGLLERADARDRRALIPRFTAARILAKCAPRAMATPRMAHRILLPRAR